MSLFAWLRRHAASTPCRWIIGALGAGVAGGCLSANEPTYSIEIRGPADTFVGATKVSLLIGASEVSSVAVTGMGTFSLQDKSLDPNVTTSTIVGVRAVDAANNLVAFGQTPEMEVLQQGNNVVVFVQKPATLARTGDLPYGLEGHVAVAAQTFSATSLSLMMTAPALLSGRRRDTSGPQAGVDRLTNDLTVYNPITHAADPLMPTGNVFRTDAAGLARDDGRIYLFGGLALGASNPTTPAPTSECDVFDLGRQTFSTFVRRDDPLVLTGDATIPRSQAVMVAAGVPVFAIGGLDGAGHPLATIVSVDDTQPTNQMKLLGLSLKYPRVGHTATAVTTNPVAEAWGNIMVYGGAPAMTPMGVAEVFDPLMATPVTINAASTPGALSIGRRGHAALLVPSSTEQLVLLLGGQGDDGHARGDSFLYTPSKVLFAPGNVTLHTPRWGFAAFVVSNDLVVAGGLTDVDTPGQPHVVADAEIFDATTGAFVKSVPAVGRSAASATVLPNLSVVLVGGDTAGVPSPAVEIYQPRRS